MRRKLNPRVVAEYRKEADTTFAHLTEEERDRIAEHIARTHPGFHSHGTPDAHMRSQRLTWLAIAIAVIALIVLAWGRAHAEPPEYNLAEREALRALIVGPRIFGQGIIPPSQFKFDASNNLDVNCISGCSASAGFTDNSAFTVGASTINPMGAYFTSGADPACTTGNACRLRIDASSNLRVNCVTGCSASAGFADNAAFTAGTTPISITGGWFSSAPTACTNGSACSPSLTSDRKMFVQSFQGTSPWVVSANGGSFAVTGAFFQATQPVSCSAAATCPVNASQVGTWTDRIVGNAGGAMDAAGQNVASPANELLIGCQFQTTPTTIAAGNMSPVQCGPGGATITQYGSGAPFSCVVASTVTVTTQCQAAPAAGLRNYVTHVSMTNAAATVIKIDVVYGTGAACATGTTALTTAYEFGTLATTTNSFVVSLSFPTPLVPAAANAICVRPSAATAFGATITGYIAP